MVVSKCIDKVIVVVIPAAIIQDIFTLDDLAVEKVSWPGYVRHTRIQNSILGRFLLSKSLTG